MATAAQLIALNQEALNKSLEYRNAGDSKQASYWGHQAQAYQKRLQKVRAGHDDPVGYNPTYETVDPEEVSRTSHTKGVLTAKEGLQSQLASGEITQSQYIAGITALEGARPADTSETHYTALQSEESMYWSSIKQIEDSNLSPGTKQMYLEEINREHDAYRQRYSEGTLEVPTGFKFSRGYEVRFGTEPERGRVAVDQKLQPIAPSGLDTPLESTREAWEGREAQLERKNYQEYISNQPKQEMLTLSEAVAKGVITEQRAHNIREASFTEFYSGVLDQAGGQEIHYNPDANSYWWFEKGEPKTEPKTKEIDAFGMGKGWGSIGADVWDDAPSELKIKDVEYSPSRLLYEWGKSTTEKLDWDDELKTKRQQSIGYLAAMVGEFGQTLLGPHRFIMGLIPGEQLWETKLDSAITVSNLREYEDLTDTQQTMLNLGGIGPNYLGNLIAYTPVGAVAKGVLSTTSNVISGVGSKLGLETPKFVRSVASFISSHPKATHALLYTPLIASEGIEVSKDLILGVSPSVALSESALRMGGFMGIDAGFSTGLSMDIPIKYGKVDIPLERGASAKWKGFYLNYGDDTRRLTGATSFLDDMDDILNLTDDLGQRGIETGYVPSSKIETQITKDTMGSLGYADDQIKLVDNIQDTIRSTHDVSSAFIDEYLPSKISTLSDDGTAQLKRFFLENVDEIDQVYGSFPTRAQLSDEIYEYALGGKSALRVPGDIDVMVRGSPDDVADFASRLVDDLRGVGETVRISDTSPTLIESLVGDDKWAHAVDIHSVGEVIEGTLPDYAWGFKVAHPTIMIEELPVQALGEQGLRKGVSIMGFQDDFGIGPLAHRIKDIPDFVQVQQTLIDSRKGWPSSVQGNLDQVIDYFGVKNIADITNKYDDFLKIPYQFGSRTSASRLKLDPYLGAMGIVGFASQRVSSKSFESELISVPSDSYDFMLSPSEPLLSQNVYDPPKAKTSPSKASLSSKRSMLNITSELSLPSKPSGAYVFEYPKSPPRSSYNPFTSQKISDISKPSRPKMPSVSDVISIPSIDSPSKVTVSPSDLLYTSPSEPSISDLIYSPPSEPYSPSKSPSPYILKSPPSSPPSSPPISPLIGYEDRKYIYRSPSGRMGWETKVYPLPDILGWENKKYDVLTAKEMFGLKKKTSRIATPSEAYESMLFGKPPRKTRKRNSKKPTKKKTSKKKTSSKKKKSTKKKTRKKSTRKRKDPFLF